MTQLNQITSWVMLAILVLAPIPFGSTRAFFWGLFAFVVGIWAFIYTISLVFIHQEIRVSIAKFTPPLLLMALFCGWMIVQLLPLGLVPVRFSDGFIQPVATISIAPDATVLALIRHLTYALFFFLMVQATANETRRRTMFSVILAVIVAYGVYGLVSLQAGDTILGLEKWAYSGYATGTFINRNSFATFLAMGGTLAAARLGKLLADASRQHPNDGMVRNLRSDLLIYGMAYAFLMVVVVSTGSRMGLFVLLVGGGISATIPLRRAKRLSILALVVPVSLAAMGMIMIVFGGGLLDRLGSIETNSDIRSDLYRQVWELIMQRPLTGFGAGSFEIAFPIVHLAPVSSDLVWSKAHNTYLALWAETGLVFGSLPLIALGLIGARLITAVVRKRGNVETQAIALGVLSIGAIHSMVDFSLEIPAVTFVFLALLAAGASSTVNLKAGS
ncbi:MAG: O-antigen ligase family protein [Devosia sp.]